MSITLFIALLLALTLTSYLVVLIFNLPISTIDNIPKDRILAIVWIVSIKFITIGPPNFLTLFFAGKMLKEYVIKMEEKSRLIDETSSAELQLLKAQIHPHFLFNTLNNIYSFNINQSPVAAELILKLTDTLKYMINDCEAELVPLEKEIKMLQDYIGLEKVRYGQRLNLIVDMKGDLENKLISPLLLIPFVENSFKHGASKMLEHPWINIKIIVQDCSLIFKISNSKPDNEQQLNGLHGIGLTNVRKRLQLLYSRDHILEVTTGDHSFHVKLKLPLHIHKSESKLTGTPEPVLA